MQKGQEQKNRYKITVYIMTLLIEFGYIAFFGITSRLKQPIAKDLLLSETVLGLGDNLAYLGRFFGSVYIFLTPPQKLKRDLIFHTLMSIILMECVIFGKIFPSFGTQIYTISMFLGGFSRAYVVLPWFILTGVLGKSKKEKLWMNLWYGFTYLGDAMGVLENEVFLVNLNLEWHISLSVSLGIFLICLIFFGITVQQISLTEENSDHSIQGLSQYAKVYFKSISNCLLTANYVFVGTVYYSILLWLPYYFLQIGYKTSSSLIAASFSIASMLGVPFYSILANRIKNVGILLLFLLFCNLLICLALKDLRDDPQDKLTYFILILGLGFFISGPEVRVVSEDPKCKARSDNQIYLNLMICRLFHQFMGGFILLFSGYLLEKSIYTFFIYILGLIGISFLVVLARVYLYFEQFQLKQGAQQEGQENDEEIIS